jgi:hypothetical protein
LCRGRAAHIRGHPKQALVNAERPLRADARADVAGVAADRVAADRAAADGAAVDRAAADGAAC